MGKAAHTDWEWLQAARIHREHRSLPISGVVQHYTAGGSGRALARWVAGLTRVKGKVVPPPKYYAHLTVCRDGHVLQQAPFDSVCLHAGGRNRGRWSGIDAHVEINEFTVGIENSNYGWLIKDGTDFYVPRKNPVTKKWSKGRRYPKKLLRPQLAVGHDGVERWWEPFPTALRSSNMQVLQVLAGLCPELDADRVLRHSDISPNRKHDPGPLFPFEVMSSYAFLDDDNSDVEFEDMEARRYYDEDSESCLSPVEFDPEMSLETE
jgi:N-acetyl-anhydromuramyl-L-alanine amidase AmpD